MVTKPSHTPYVMYVGDMCILMFPVVCIAFITSKTVYVYKRKERLNGHFSHSTCIALRVGLMPAAGSAWIVSLNASI